MPPLRLAVDARVIAEDTRGIGRYARAVLRRLAASRRSRPDAAGVRAFSTGTTLRICSRSGQRQLCRSGQACLAIPMWCGIRPTVPSSRLGCRASRRSTTPFPFVIPIPTPNGASTRRGRFCARHARRRASSPFRSSGATKCTKCSDVALERIAVIPHGVEREFLPGPAAGAAAGVAGAALSLVRRRSDRPSRARTLRCSTRRTGARGPMATDRCWPLPRRSAPAAAGRRCDRQLRRRLITGNDATLRRVLSRRPCAGAGVVSRDVRHADARSDGLRHAGGRRRAPSSLPEVGGDAALYAPPDDADAWAAALRRIVDDAALRERLRGGGDRARGGIYLGDAARSGTSAVFRAVGAMIRLGVDAWNLPGDRRGIGRYLR